MFEKIRPPLRYVCEASSSASSNRTFAVDLCVTGGSSQVLLKHGGLRFLSLFELDVEEGGEKPTALTEHTGATATCGARFEEAKK